MINWTQAATINLGQVKATTKSNDAKMQSLKAQIEAWANASPSTFGNSTFDFGSLRGHFVSVTKSGGSIQRVIYG